jgi:hypothetical protein
VARSARRTEHLALKVTDVLSVSGVVRGAAASPLLALTSPEKRCGKTTTLSLLTRLVPRPLLSSNISPAALFRIVEKYCPTLLIDEADSFLRDKEELRGILNSGHTRDAAYVVRTVGDDKEPCRFSTWAPKAVALIGRLSVQALIRYIRGAGSRRSWTKRAQVFRSWPIVNKLVLIAKTCHTSSSTSGGTDERAPQQRTTLGDLVHCPNCDRPIRAGAGCGRQLRIFRHQSGVVRQHDRCGDS